MTFRGWYCTKGHECESLFASESNDERIPCVLYLKTLQQLVVDYVYEVVFLFYEDIIYNLLNKKCQITE